MKKFLTYALSGLLVLLIAGAGFYLWWAWSFSSNSPTVQDDASVVRQTVTDFGHVLKNVPLSGTKEIADQAMDQNYAPYLAASLLVQWKDDPSQALGRLTSSPWPDRIDIVSSTKVNDSVYSVTGNVVEITSQDIAQGTPGGMVPVQLQLQKTNGFWLITSVTWQTEQQNPPTTAQHAVFDADAFTVEYPIEYHATTGQGLGGANLDTSLVSIALPDGLFSASGTNYVESYIVLSESTSTSAVGNCTSFADVAEQASSSTDASVNGVSFKQADTVGVAAGNIYTSKLYRTVHGGVCYEAALVVHTGNVGNYDPPVSEFDQSLALGRLDAILQTLRFK